MLKKKADAKDVPKFLQGRGTAGQNDQITEENIAEAEKETLENASKAISLLENALAKWEASKDKPEDLMKDFARYRAFRDELAQWMTKALKSRESLPFEKRAEHLRKFVEICYKYR